jgi:hypothetical protein
MNDMTLGKMTPGAIEPKRSMPRAIEPQSKASSSHQGQVGATEPVTVTQGLTGADTYGPRDGVTDMLGAMQQRDADDAMAALGHSFKMPTEEDIPMKEQADLDEAITRSKQDQMHEARERKAQKRAARSPQGRLWQKSQRRARQDVQDDDESRNTPGATAVSEPVKSKSGAIELAQSANEKVTESDSDRLYVAACCGAPDDEKSLLEVARRLGCRPRQNKKIGTDEQKIINNAAQRLQKKETQGTLSAPSKAYLEALSQKAPQKTKGRQCKPVPTLRDLYDEAVENASAEDRDFLEKVKALGHYPHESLSKTTAEKKLAMQARDRQRSKNANAQVNAYLVALKNHSADQTKVDKETSIADALIEEVRLFVQQNRRMPRRLPPNAQSPKKRKGDTEQHIAAGAKDIVESDGADGIVQPEDMDLEAQCDESTGEAEDKEEDEEEKTEGEQSSADNDREADEDGDVQGHGKQEKDDPETPQPDDTDATCVSAAMLYEDHLAQRLLRARNKKGTLTTKHLDELVALDPWCHEEVEGAWNALRQAYWSDWEDVKHGRNFKKALKENDISKEVFELLRDVDSVRGQLDKNKLLPLARRLGFRTCWWLNNRTRHWSCDKLQHYCRSCLCDRASDQLRQRVAGATDPTDQPNENSLERDADFHTPVTSKDFASSLLHPDRRLVTPFAENFMHCAFRAQVPRPQLLHHLLVAEGHVGSVVDTPMLSKERLRLLREGGALEPTDGNPYVEISEDSLKRDLLALLKSSDENEDRWMVRCLSKTSGSMQQPDLSKIVSDFFEFVLQNELTPSLQLLAPRRVVTLCIWHAHLETIQKKIMVPPSDRTTCYMPKPCYIPGDRIDAPEVAHFRQMAEEDGPPVALAPRQCQLCGEGFTTFEHLRRHCDHKHGNWKVYRKRLFYEANKLVAQPLPKARKRQQLANFTHHLTFSRPGDGGAPEPRRQEACAVCARKDWLEFRYRTYLFQQCSDGGEAMELTEVDEDSAGDDEDSNAKDTRKTKEYRENQLLRDSEGKYYFGDVDQINALLSVDRYRDAFPQIPLEELHASSVQHPQHPEYRWLLHSRRVPVLSAEDAREVCQASAAETASLASQSKAATEREGASYLTAGVGDPNETCWLFRCHLMET